MSFLSRFFGEGKALSRSDILRELVGAGGGSKAGVNVTWKTALQVSTAYACARKIAEGLAQVPFKLMREDGQVRNPAREHPLYDLLTRAPNEWQTSFEFREQIGLHLALCGEAFVWRNVFRGRVQELLPYTPQQVTVLRHEDWSRSYRIATDQGRQITVPQEEMWHIKGPSWDGISGLSAVKLAREALGLGLATEEHAARMFSNGAQVGGILSTDSNLTRDDRKELRESWERTQGGLRNAFNVAILWGGLKFTPRAQQNDQAQLVELRKQQVEEICRFFGVMPIMVGYSDKTATYASVEQMMIAHVVHTLGPWHARLEQSADMALLTEQDRRDGHYFHFVTAGLLRGDAKARAEYFGKALGSGGSPAWMTQDEVRALEELNPMGGSAAVLPIPTNVGGAPAGGNSDAQP